MSSTDTQRFKSLVGADLGKRFVVVVRGGGGCLFACMLACLCLFVGYLTSQQHASESQGRICSDPSSHSILTPGQPVPALILLRPAGQPLECQCINH